MSRHRRIAILILLLCGAGLIMVAYRVIPSIATPGGPPPSRGDAAAAAVWAQEPRPEWSDRSAGLCGVTVGMASDEVIHLLGRPDEVHALHEPYIKTGKRIGTTLFYLEIPASGIGGGHEEIRVYVDLQGRVMKTWDDVGGTEHELGTIPRRRRR